jgi:hypothetical protein
MFIPDPNFSIPDPGSKRFRIPDPHQIIKEILNQNTVFKLSEIRSGMLIPDPDLDCLPILDPGSGSATLIWSIFVQNHRQAYKQAFVDKDLWKVLADTLRYVRYLMIDDTVTNERLIPGEDNLTVNVKYFLHVDVNLFSTRSLRN